MKTKILHLLFLVCLLSVYTQAQNFTWVNGNNFNGVTPGVYGTMGVASSTNYPGHRHGCATWTDASGNLWLFGGEGVSATASLSWLNDLWKFNPSTNQWTWVRGSNAPDQPGTYGSQGVASNANDPGAREFMMFWTDASGNFWLFGGEGFDGSTGFGGLNDLWRYNPNTNQWTWMKGSNLADQTGIYGSIGVSNTANVPGGRASGACWKDGSGNLWIFGGEGFAASGTADRLSDLWRYNPTTNQWTWMHGPNTTFQVSNYGTLGVPSVTNNPGAREQPASWADASGNLYLFGGRGLSVGPGNAYLNDLWRYNITNDTWTWVRGANANNPVGQHGTLGVASNTNNPGGRFAAGMWTDAGGNFWLFGGLGWSGTGNLGNLNDLWKYDPVVNQWTWIKGSNAINTAGIYGSIGVASPNVFPGARHYNNTWRTFSNRLWLFGGEGIDNNNSNPIENMNDMWGYVPPCNPDSINTSLFNVCTGGQVTLTANTQYSSNVLWYNSATSTNSIGAGNTFNTGTLSAMTSPSVYTYYAQANNCTLTPRAMVQVTVNPSPTISIAGGGSVCAGSSTTLSASGASSYTWANGVMTNVIVVSPVNNFTYSVIGAALGCTNSAASAITVLALPSLTASVSRTIMCKFETNTLSALGASNYTWSNQSIGASLVITPTIVGNLSYTVTGTDNFGCKNTATVSVNVAHCGGSVIENNKYHLQLNIYPNPSNGSFTFKNESNLEELNLEIYNGLGQLVFINELDKNEIEIKSRLANGIYYYVIKQNTEALKSGKLIVE